MAYFIKPIDEERCVTLSYEGGIPPLEIAAARYEALNARRWDPVLREPYPHFDLCNRGRTASSDITRGPRQATIAET